MLSSPSHLSLIVSGHGQYRLVEKYSFVVRTKLGAEVLAEVGGKIGGLLVQEHLAILCVASYRQLDVVDDPLDLFAET